MQQTVTICASFAITCALSSKQMTPNDCGPYEGHKKAHEQNEMLRKHQHFMIVIIYFSICFGSRKHRDILCNSHTLYTAITCCSKVMQPVFVCGGLNMSVFGDTADFVYAQQNEQMMFGPAASGLPLKPHTHRHTQGG